jgi:hypothetical protein
MQNEFSKKTRELFDLGGYMMSWETGRNNADCLHHIMGRASNSPYNAAPLNNRADHQPEGRKGLPPLSSQIIRCKYLKKTKRFLDSIDYNPTEEDLQFLEKYKSYYD